MSHECFADEIAIDFPSVGRVVERMRDAFLGEDGSEWQDHSTAILTTEVRLSKREACVGLVVPLDVPIRGMCPDCGGRGGSWTERCALCRGTGDSLIHHPVRLAVPAGVANGTTIRFRVNSPNAASVRVEVRVAIEQLIPDP